MFYDFDAAHKATVWSVGHSNMSWDTWEGLLQAHGIRAVVDIRAIPASRRWPHFNRDVMGSRLADAGIRYRWISVLGRPRHRGRPDSPHRGWRVPAFRSYADYMDTDAFRAGLHELMALAKKRPTAFLCAEALYWRCHRRLVADALTHLGWRVLHIRNRSAPAEHQYPAFLRVVDGRLLYDGASSESRRYSLRSGWPAPLVRLRSEGTESSAGLRPSD